MKWKLNIHHILPVALSILLPLLSIYANPSWEILNGTDFLLSWFVASALLYVLWHLLWYLGNSQSVWKTAGTIVVLLLISGLLMGMAHNFLARDLSEIRWVILGRIGLACILYLAIQYALKAQTNIAKLRLDKEQALTETYKVQLSAMRTKVDPHFLFNSLNTLRSMVRQQHEHSEQFIISLASYYRQTLKYNENSTLFLSEELGVLESYLFLMENRNEEAVQIDMQIDPVYHDSQIPTLALQMVLENCFKHNSMTSKRPLFIDIKSTGDGYVEVSNNIQPKLEKSSDSGYGLDLLRKRYEMMEAEQGIIVSHSQERFSVKLKLI